MSDFFSFDLRVLMINMFSNYSNIDCYFDSNKNDNIHKINLPKNHNSKVHDDSDLFDVKNLCKNVNDQHV